jgi:glucan phosphoethanolaminetransferase (alkaline phosphatase superfamily)
MTVARVIRRLALDVLIWYGLSAIFLALYVRRFGQPATAVAAHLAVIAIPLLTSSLARFFLQQSMTNSALRRLASTLLTGSLLTLLIAYYAIVLIGLRSWGGVVAWNVIPTLFATAYALADALAVPLFVLVIAACAAYLTILLICWLYLARFDWAGTGPSPLSRPMRTTVVAGATVFLALQTFQLCAKQYTLDSEPVRLTLFPPKAALDMEGYSGNPIAAAPLDRLADQARKAYVPAATVGKNLVLIVVDALRPDHMGIYGYRRPTTPHLDRIVSQHETRIIHGTHASCADTTCALFSLSNSQFTNEFSFHPIMLQEAARRNGYRVHLVLSGDHTYFYSLKSFYGPVDSFYDGTQARGYEMNDDQLVIDHIASMPDWDGKPAMFQIHLMSSHLLRKTETVPGPYQPARRYALRDSADRGPGGDPPDTALNFYDNGVVEADSVINTILTLLGKKGYLGDALVAVTADHGESLGEHGLFTHANSVREEVLRIPLVLVAYGSPFRSDTAYRTFSSQVDIAPTLFTELGLPVPGTWSGRPLQDAQGLTLSYFAEHQFAGGD